MPSSLKPRRCRCPIVGANHKLLKVLEMACRKILGPAPKKQDIVHDVRSLIVEGLARGDRPYRHGSLQAQHEQQDP